MRRYAADWPTLMGPLWELLLGRVGYWPKVNKKLIDWSTLMGG